MADPTAQLVSQALELASAGADLYSLLELPASLASENDIRRAWRKVGLKYHPDRVGADDAAAKETYERCRVARDVLLEPAAKAAYDGAREAEVRRLAERDKMDSARRDMVEDLERREAAARAAGGGEAVRASYPFSTAAAAPGSAGGGGGSGGLRGTGVGKGRSPEEEERLRKAFARGREIEKERRRKVEEAEERERAREEEARGKSLCELDKEEEELRRKLEAVREKKAAKDEARRARKSNGPFLPTAAPVADDEVEASAVAEGTEKMHGSGRRKERARYKALAEQEGQREKERDMKAAVVAQQQQQQQQQKKEKKQQQQQQQQQAPPPPFNFDPSKKYTIHDDFESTLSLLRQTQEDKIAAGKAERTSIPLEEKSFVMPGGRTVRVPKYSFRYRLAAASAAAKTPRGDGNGDTTAGGDDDFMQGVEQNAAGVGLEDTLEKLGEKEKEKAGPVWNGAGW